MYFCKPKSIITLDKTKMKTCLKMLLGLVVGACAGLLIAGLAVTILKDMTWAEYFAKFELGDIILILNIFVAVFVAIIVHIAVHEAGHLVAGLMSGYRFVSYRIGSFTLLRRNGRYIVRRFSIVGTGGQCLMLPPNKPVEKIPTSFYLMGGIIVNLIITIVSAGLLLCCDFGEFAVPYLGITAFIGLFFVVINGLPLRSLMNDGYNTFLLRKDINAKRFMLNMLHVHAALQDGKRMKDLPAYLFEADVDMDNLTPLGANMLCMYVALALDKKEWDKVNVLCAETLMHEKNIPTLFVNELKCEYIFTLLMTDNIEKAKELYDDKKLKAYIDQTKNVVPERQRLLCAIALLLDGDRHKAEEIADFVKTHRDGYIHIGSVDSEIDIINDVLACEA